MALSPSLYLRDREEHKKKQLKYLCHSPSSADPSHATERPIGACISLNYVNNIQNKMKINLKSRRRQGLECRIWNETGLVNTLVAVHRAGAELLNFLVFYSLSGKWEDNREHNCYKEARRHLVFHTRRALTRWLSTWPLPLQ